MGITTNGHRTLSTKVSTKVSTLVAVVMGHREISTTYIEWRGQQAQESMIHSLKKKPAVKIMLIISHGIHMEIKMEDQFHYHYLEFFIR